MSVVGVRSYEYQWATALDKDLSRAVEQLEADPKGEAHGAPQMRVNLILRLRALAELLDPLSEDAQLDATEALRIPVPVLQRLRDTRVGDCNLRDALAATIARLSEEQVALSADDFKVLHSILAATSDEASDAFDRVLRR
jgi:hypothetical protein